MGTNIHLFIEARTHASGVWELVSGGPRSLWQNYAEFAILAGVRNEFGIVPVAQPRGLPPDMSSKLREINSNHYSASREDEWERLREEHAVTYGDGHLGEACHSWLTLEELLAYNWNQRANFEGVVGPKEFATFLADGKPKSYSGGVSGRGVKFVSNDAMRRFVEAGLAAERDELHGPLGVSNKWNIYTDIEWTESYKEAAPDLHARFIPELTRWATAHRFPPEDVRIVFGFQ